MLIGRTFFSIFHFTEKKENKKFNWRQKFFLGILRIFIVAEKRGKISGGGKNSTKLWNFQIKFSLSANGCLQGEFHSMNLYDSWVGWVFTITEHVKKAEIYSLQMPMTPQARRAPAFPVDLLSSCPPSPKSSWSAWTTTVRPKMLKLPTSEMFLSEISTLATPESSATTFPKSPACLTSCVGPPCSLPKGLKWGPADMHPFVLSPNSWMWNPCKPAFNPETSPVTLTGSDSD